MLPGLRFLFVAILMAVSMVVFGLGAAALLRATHEEFASLPLKQMPEVTFGSREDTQQPTLAVLQVDTPAAGPTPEHAEAPVATAPGAQPDSTDIVLPAADAASGATDSTASAASPALSDSAAPSVSDTAPAAEAATEKPSEPPPVDTSIEAGDAVKPDIAKAYSANAGAATTDVANTDVAKSDAPKSAGASDVAETMTSPFGANFKPPLPGHRPTQIAQATGKASSVAKRSSAKPTLAKRAHRRQVIRQPGRLRPAAPPPASQPASPFALE
ncbi:hypothetical protein [Nitrobacter sp.]|uniref:hypothetical protein n=1 Tax=Nitrobacter sp. TaxID=29420 RepID=UPI003F64B325